MPLVDFRCVWSPVNPMKSWWNPYEIPVESHANHHFPFPVVLKRTPWTNPFLDVPSLSGLQHGADPHDLPSQRGTRELLRKARDDPGKIGDISNKMSEYIWIILNIDLIYQDMQLLVAGFKGVLSWSWENGTVIEIDSTLGVRLNTPHRFFWGDVFLQTLNFFCVCVRVWRLNRKKIEQGEWSAREYDWSGN